MERISVTLMLIIIDANVYSNYTPAARSFNIHIIHFLQNTTTIIIITIFYYNTTTLQDLSNSWLPKLPEYASTQDS